MKHFFVLFLCTFMLLSCSRKHPADTATLSYTVTSFSVPVTSISQSKQNDSIVFVGFENGNVMIKNTYTDEQVTINAGYNRVYDVMEYTADILLVGIRDEGLKAVRVTGKGEATVLKAYPTAEKATNYGVYSIARDEQNGRFVLGTSNGCFTFQNPEDTILQPCHEQLHAVHHYGFNKVLCIDGKTYMASDSALFVEEKGEITHTLLAGKTVVNLFCKDTLLYASTGNDGIYRINLRNGSDTMLPLPGYKAYAFLKDPLGGTWTVGNDKIIYQPAQRDESFVHPIPQGVSISGKQMVCSDRNFIYLACGDQLLTFPVHQNVDGKRGSVIALGKNDQNTVFFISGDYKLYAYQEGSFARLRGKIKGLEIHDNILQSEIKNGFFRIATNKTLFKIDVEACKLVQMTPVNPPGQSRNDIRCLFYDNDTTLYIGTRHNLYVTNPARNEALRLYEKLKDPYNDLYVTSLCRIADKLYVGTLNKGLFAIHDDCSVDTLLSAKNDYGNIRHLAVENAQLYVHTSKNIYRYVGKNTMDVLPNIRLNSSKSIRSIIADSLSQTVAVLGNHGFAQLRSLSADTCDRLFYRDITFNNAALAFLGDSSLVIGNRSGLYHYTRNGLSSIHLEPEKVFPWIQFGISVLILLYLISVFFVSRYERQKQQQTAKCRLNDFLRRIENHLETIEKQVIDKTAQKKLHDYGDILKTQITIELQKRFISPPAIDTLSNELYEWKLRIDKKTISLDNLKKVNKDREELEKNLANVQYRVKQSGEILKTFFEKMKKDTENIKVSEKDLVEEKNKIIEDIDALPVDAITLQSYAEIEKKTTALQSRVTILKQKAERQKRLKMAREEYNLDTVDFEILEFLSIENYEHKNFYTEHSRMVEGRQARISAKLGCKNRKYYIITTAYRLGILIPQ